ncbi:MAG: hypothetical protein PWP04_1490, partial [Candidatus Atribacteria bacterium]|nr:hypothetical protein [Candidatus Atribacteria bacterium]
STNLARYKKYISANRMQPILMRIRTCPVLLVTMEITTMITARFDDLRQAPFCRKEPVLDHT